MKLLAIDVGNSEIKQATITDGIVGTVRRDSTRDIDHVAELIAATDDAVALCSVRSAASEKIRTVLANKQKQLVLEINSQTQKPVSGFYDGMGADRIAEISAAWNDFGGTRPVAVVGLGTATTITTASKEGKFTGGYITMGLGAICATLTDALPELPPVDPRFAKTLDPGFDVYSSICHGTVAGHIGIVNQWVSLFREKLGDDLAVVAAGGWSELLAPFCTCFDKVDPYLALRGVWTIYNAN